MLLEELVNAKPTSASRNEKMIYRDIICDVIRCDRYLPSDLPSNAGVVEHHFQWVRAIRSMEKREPWYSFVRNHEREGAEYLLNHHVKDHVWWLAWTSPGCEWEFSAIYTVLERMDAYFYAYKTGAIETLKVLKNVDIASLPAIPIFTETEKKALHKEILNPWDTRVADELSEEMQCYLYLWNRAMGNTFDHDSIWDTLTEREQQWCHLEWFNEVWHHHQQSLESVPILPELSLYL